MEMIPKIPDSTSRTPRDRLWHPSYPWLILGAIIVLFVTFSGRRPDSIVDGSPTRLPGLGHDASKELLGGLWRVLKIDVGAQIVFSWDQETKRIRGADFATLQLGMSQWTGRIAKETIQFTSTRDIRVPKTPDQWTIGPSRTEMVFVARFDTQGLGTLDALPIQWNEEKDGVLAQMDAGVSRKGVYELNGRRLRLFLPANSGPRRDAIPERLLDGEYLIVMERYDPVSERNVFLPPDLPKEFSGKILSTSDDGVVTFIDVDLGRSEMRVEELPQPVKTPITKAVDPPPDGAITFCHTNGWIVQTIPGPRPMIPPPAPTDALPVRDFLEVLKKE